MKNINTTRQYFLAILFGIFSITMLVINTGLVGAVDTTLLITDFVAAAVLGVILVRLCRKNDHGQMKTHIWLTVIILVALCVISLIINCIWGNSSELIAVCNHILAIIALLVLFILLTSLKPIIMSEFSIKNKCFAVGVSLVSCICALILTKAYSPAAFEEIISVFWIYSGALFFNMQKEYLITVSQDRKYIWLKKIKWTCIFFLSCVLFMLVVTMICAPGNKWLGIKENVDNLLSNAIFVGKGHYSFELANFTRKDNPFFVLLYYHGYAWAIGYLILNFIYTFIAVKCVNGSKDFSGDCSMVLGGQIALYTFLLRFVLSILSGLNQFPLSVYPVLSGRELGMIFDLAMILLIYQSQIATIRNLHSTRSKDNIAK